MANQLEEVKCVKTQSSSQNQNYLSGNLLYVLNDLSNRQKINKQIPNKQVQEILINEGALIQSNLDITIQKKTQSFISRFTKQQNLKEKYQRVLNIQNNQLSIKLNSDPFSQKKKNIQSLSFASQDDSQSNKQYQEKNYSQLNKQSQGSKDLENNIKQQSQKITLISNQSLKQNFDQIYELMINELNSQYQNFQEKNLEKQNSIQQIVIQSNIFDDFNQKNVLAYKESSQTQSEKNKSNHEHFNDIDENIQFKQSLAELMCQIELDLISKQYYLTDFVQSFEYEDIYLGYQNKDNIKSQTLVFKIIYNPSQQNKVINRQKIQSLNKDLDNKKSKTIDLIDLQYQCSYQDVYKLIQAIEWDEQINLKCDRIISYSNTSKILVMKQDNYIQIMQKFSYHKEQIKVWNYDYFKQVNEGQEIFTNHNDKLLQNFNKNQEIILIRQIYQGNHYKISSSLLQLAKCYANISQYDQALDLSLQSLQMDKQIYQGSHSKISSSLFQVAECYANLSLYEKSLNFSLESLQMKKQIYQGNHSKISSSLFQVAECYANLSQYKKALEFMQQIDDQLNNYLMENLSEKIRCFKTQSSRKSQNYFNGYLLCVIDGLSNEQKINKKISNKFVEEILIKEDTLRQSNLDITIKKKAQAFISRFTDQQNLKEIYQSVLNVQNNQLSVILSFDHFSETKKNNQSLSFISQNYSQPNNQSQQNNDSQLNKQSQRNKDLENNIKQQSKKSISILNYSLKQNLDQKQQPIIDKFNSQNSQQIFIETSSDPFNQKHVQPYQENSQSQSELDKRIDECIYENIEFEQCFIELMCQIELDLIQNYYYLTGFVQSFEYEDIYLGYQNKGNIEYQTLVFKIIYNPSQHNREINRQKIQILNKNLDNKESNITNLIELQYQCSYYDVDKLIQTIEWDEQVNLKSDRIISCSNTAKILVMKYDNYIQIMQNFQYNKEQIKVWNYDYFKQVNQGQEIFTQNNKLFQNFNQNQEIILKNTDSKADIYSLGKTFLDIIKVYEKQSGQIEVIKKLKNLIDDKMLQQNAEQRDNINHILNQLPQNNDKDIPYFAQLDLYYTQIALDISQNKYQTLFDIKSNSQMLIISKYLFKISICHKQLSQYDQALKCQKESYKIVKQFHKDNQSEISSSLLQLSKCYANLSQYKEALDLSLKSLQMDKEIYQDNHFKISSSLFQAAKCYANLSQYKEALDLSLQSLQMNKQIYQENHSKISSSLFQVAQCYAYLSQYEKALNFSHQSLQMNKQIQQGNHSSISSSLFQVAECYTNLSQYEKALEFSLQSLQMDKQIYQGNHSSISSSLFQVAECYANLSQYKKALEFSLQSLQMNKQIYQGNHSEISSSLFQVAECYTNLCQYQKALDFSLQSLQIKRQIYLGNHSLISSSLFQVAECYTNLSQYQKALDISLQSLHMNKQIQQGNHPSIQLSLLQVSNNYLHLRNYKKATECLKQALLVRRQYLIYNQQEMSQQLFQP
ncbi:hypothetical protein ABPG74_007884 [Tetrahymena malaccensis]